MSVVANIPKRLCHAYFWTTFKSCKMGRIETSINSGSGDDDLQSEPLLLGDLPDEHMRAAVTKQPGLSMRALASIAAIGGGCLGSFDDGFSKRLIHSVEFVSSCLPVRWEVTHAGLKCAGMDKV
jgi:hypothetical protein